MMGSLYYEVTASGRRVALCVDKQDAEIVASHWYDAQVRELPYAFISTIDPQITQPGYTYTYSPLIAPPAGVAKRKEDTQP